MPSFGRYGSFPARMGGGLRPIEAVHRALLDQYRKGFDVSEDQPAFFEAYAEAALIAQGWAGTERLRNQSQPLKMCENMPIWEESTGLRPGSADSTQQRRQALAGKLRGSSGNTLTDIHDSLAELTPEMFVAVRTTSVADEITWWPVENPGPPGFEWSSNLGKLHVEMLPSAGASDDYERAVAKAAQQLDRMLPDTMTYGFFSDEDGFHVGVSKLGVTGL